MKLIAISIGQDTFGRGTNRHGTAAIVNRNAVISVGENSSSAIRLATKASPQITATRRQCKVGGFHSASQVVGSIHDVDACLASFGLPPHRFAMI